MKDFLQYYFSVQLLFLLSWLCLKCFQKAQLRLSSQSLLKLSYFLTLLSTLLPFIQFFTPSHNPFGPIAKAHEWVTPVKLTQTLDTFSSAQAILAPHRIHHDYSLTLSFYLILSIVTLFLIYILVKVLKLFSDFYKTQKVIKNSFLYKSWRSVQIRLTEKIHTPFSFYNGRYQIVLPIQILQNKSHFKLSLAHEIQHHRQKDTLWIYFIKIVEAVFDLSPIAKRWSAEILKLQELACDEALIGRKAISPLGYSQCLYELAQQQQQVSVATPIGAIGIAIEPHILKRRIEVMFQPTKITSPLTKWIAVTLTTLLLTASSWALKSDFSDELISLEQAQKLAQKISSQQEIPIIVDQKVLYWLHKATESESAKKYMRDTLRRMEAYKPTILAQLKEASLPEELLAVPIIESGYRNQVISTAHAIGIWQFISRTARNYGLKVNNKVDERRDTLRSTQAATLYYKDLYAIFQNWHVALSAYNIGEMAMLRAIKKANHNDALKLARDGYLGSEGGRYLPKLMASMIILKYPQLVE